MWPWSGTPASSQNTREYQHVPLAQAGYNTSNPGAGSTPGRGYPGSSRVVPSTSRSPGNRKNFSEWWCGHTANDAYSPSSSPYPSQMSQARNAYEPAHYNYTSNSRPRVDPRVGYVRHEEQINGPFRYWIISAWVCCIVSMFGVSAVMWYIWYRFPPPEDGSQDSQLFNGGPHVPLGAYVWTTTTLTATWTSTTRTRTLTTTITSTTTSSTSTSTTLQTILVPVPICPPGQHCTTTPFIINLSKLASEWTSTTRALDDVAVKEIAELLLRLGASQGSTRVGSAPDGHAAPASGPSSAATGQQLLQAILAQQAAIPSTNSVGSNAVSSQPLPPGKVSIALPPMPVAASSTTINVP